MSPCRSNRHNSGTTLAARLALALIVATPSLLSQIQRTPTAAAVAPSDSLRAPVGYTTASAINQHAAIADFNGDGHLDIVTNNCTVLLGNGDGTFRTPVVYTSASNSYAVAVGDFNQDGKPDFATARYDGNIGIWINNGDGTFQPPILINTGTGPRNLVVADFNRDGIADIAYASRQGEATGIGILLGIGNSKFKPPVTYLAGQRESDLAVADFNGDGNLDIVTADSDDIETPGNILLGVGDGTFHSAGLIQATFPTLIAVGDFNRDGKPDFVIGGYFAVDQLVVYLGNGDGTFTPVSTHPLTFTSSGVQVAFTVADFDGDGNPDIAWAGGAGAVGVLIGNGDGTFRGAVNFPAGTQPEFVVAGDFDGDGHTDLAATNSNSIQILLGESGIFPVVSTTTLPGGMDGVAYSAALAATGGDSPYTWALSAGSLPAPLGISPAGIISGTPSINDSPGADAFSVMVSGANGPGFFSGQNLSIQLATAFKINTSLIFVGKVGSPYSLPLPVSGGTPPYQNWIVTAGSLPPGLALNSSAGMIGGTPTQAGAFSFTVTVNDSKGLTSLPANFTIPVVAALSFITSSLPDGSTGIPYYAVLHGSGGFPPYKNWTVASGSLPPGLTLDPGSGLISGTPTTTTGSPFTFSVTFSDGSSVSAPQQFTVPISNPGAGSITLSSSANPSLLGRAVTLTAAVQGTSSGKVTFFDGATILGVAPVTAGVATLTTTLLATGTHTLRAFSLSLPPAAVSQVVAAAPDTSLMPAVRYVGPGQGGVSGNPPIAVADFNGDGKADVATIGAAAGFKQFISLSLGNGDGTFQNPLTQLSVGANPAAIATADFNEDGITDIAVSSNYGIAVSLGNGDGTFGTTNAFGGSYFQNSMAVADFNLDGHADLISSNNTNQLQLYLGVGDGTFHPALNVTPGGTPGAVITADFNGDGIPDLAVGNGSQPGGINVMLGAGDGTFRAPVTWTVPTSPFGALSPSLIAGDVNGDGKPDLIAFGAALGKISVLLGRGDGTFAGPLNTNFSEDSLAESVALTDFDGDGVPDLVVNEPGESVVSVLYGNGNGTFSSGPSFSANNPKMGFQEMAVGEFNGDGRPDLALSLGAGGFNVLLGSSVVDRLTAYPAALSAGLQLGLTQQIQIVTLTLQTTTSTPPSFTSLQSGYPSISVSPSTGTMTLAHSPGSLYTWTATANVTFNPVGIEGTVTADIVFAAGGANVVVPAVLVVGGGPIPVGIINASGFGQSSVVAPGSYLAIYGAELAGSGTTSAASLPLPATLNGTQVTLGGIPMPLLYAAAGQINAIVPQTLTRGNSYPLVITSGHVSDPVALVVQELQPGIYSVDSSGSGPGIVADALTGNLIGTSNPAHASQILTVYCTGLGPVQGLQGQPPPADGAAAPTHIIYKTNATVTATIGGLPATVLFSGLTPTLAALYQVNVQVPAGVIPGSSVPLTIVATDQTTGAIGASNKVTIAVQ